MRGLRLATSTAGRRLAGSGSAASSSTSRVQAFVPALGGISWPCTKALSSSSSVSRSRGYASAAEATTSESPFSLLRALEGKDVLETRGDAGADIEGVVLSCTAGLVRMDLAGAVAAGCAVDFSSGARGVVLRFDRKGGALVAHLAGPLPKAGSTATLHRHQLAVRAPSSDSSTDSKGVVIDSVDRFLHTDAAPTGELTLPLLRLPAMPSPSRRRKISKHLQSGLAAVETMLPLGEGHRIGLVGPRATGKSSAARFMLASQSPDIVCVYSAMRPLERLKSELASVVAAGVRLTAISADPSIHPPAAVYAAPLCAVQLATELREKGHRVLLVLDDLAGFAEVAGELGKVAPFSAAHFTAAALDTAGPTIGPKGEERSLTVVGVFDLEPENVLEPRQRDLWHSSEPCLDVHVAFDGQLAADGVLPAIDIDRLLGGAAAAATIFSEPCGGGLGSTRLGSPTYQAPLLRQLRAFLAAKIHGGREMREKLELAVQLGLHTEIDEEEEVNSIRISRSLLGSHSKARPLRELTVLACAAMVLHFPRRRCGPTEIRTFQAALLETLTLQHPELWEALDGLETADDAAAAVLLRSLGEAIHNHRFDFRITQLEF